MKGIGGIAVNRNHPKLVVDQVSKLVEENGGVIIGLTPEGTRAKVEKWKSGLLRIAKQMDCKIALIGIDVDKKVCTFSGFFEPSGDNEKDVRDLKSFYKDFKPKIPENF